MSLLVNKDDGTVTEIPPPGMVSTKEWIAALQEMCDRHNWCKSAEIYMVEFTPLRFVREHEHQRDVVNHKYIVTPPYLTLTEDNPEWVSKADLTNACVAAMRRNRYDAAKGVPELAGRFGLELVEYMDHWTVTLKLSTEDLLEQGWDGEEHQEIELMEAIRDAVYAKFSRDLNELCEEPEERRDEREVTITYIPDPRRPEPTGSNVEEHG